MNKEPSIVIKRGTKEGSENLRQKKGEVKWKEEELGKLVHKEETGSEGKRHETCKKDVHLSEKEGKMPSGFSVWKSRN